MDLYDYRQMSHPAKEAWKKSYVATYGQGQYDATIARLGRQQQREDESNAKYWDAKRAKEAEKQRLHDIARNTPGTWAHDERLREESDARARNHGEGRIRGGFGG